ncbi:MAG: hypothetical protein EZS28_014450 [Streblomastix strix]|uniref:Uncharacterized protein n=1 Tax=Streblomastix strix TaxID=222440 RepID=A0A5J4W5V5_9EUKA|nr:MAG: hypothetical protein EZS28_014450 [Streblomastix strix]
MCDQNWYNSGDIVPDQVTTASDATPLSDGTATSGISTEYSRGEHVHQLNITISISISDSASGSVGTANYYARSDHSHPLNTTTTIPPQDSAGGAVGTTNYYARNDHSHPINVETNASNIPIVNGVGVNGSSAFYARQDHVHPQQLTHDDNITATKFIKTVGTNQQILMADGPNKQTTDFNSSIVTKDYQIYPADGIYWQCLAILTIPDYTSVQTFGCIIDINNIYIHDLFYQLKWNLRIQGGFVMKFEATQFGSIQTDFMVCADIPDSSLILKFYMKAFQRTYFILWNIILSQFSGANARDNFVLQDNINQYNITTDTQPTGKQFAVTALQNQFINNGGTINGLVQIKPTGGSYNQGIRISRSISSNYSGIFLGCNPNSTTGTQAGQ